VTAHRSAAPVESALRASVLPLADRAARVASMLDRWNAEVIADEPDWDVADLSRLALPTPSSR
jgi:hypothetical protein